MKLNRFLLKILLLWCFLAMVGFASYASAAVQVWVQPSGPDIQSAYGLVGETRTYFGRTEGGGGTYEAMWSFSDGTPATGWLAVANKNYISTSHTFLSSGLNFLILTVRDAANTVDQDSATIQVQTLSVDTDNRQKNSAIDNGLRSHYLDQDRTTEGSSWGSSRRVGQTSMAMIAFENHGHNLTAPSSDIYLQTVRDGIRWLLNKGKFVDLSVQPCIGDPEGVPGDPGTDDMDTDNDGIGITFNTESGTTSNADVWDEGYEMPLAVLAIVNSCDLATAQSLLATEGPLVGLSFFDIMVDAKDFLAFAQTDFEGTGGGGGEGEECAPTNTEWAYGHTSDPDLLAKLYLPWTQFHGGWGTRVALDTDIVLHLISEDIYIDIRFNSWSCCGNGGFGYDRTTEGVPGEQIWTGPIIPFTKPDGADWNDPVNQDTIVPGTTITRQDSQGIFNIDASPDVYSNPCGPPGPVTCQMAGWRYVRNDNSIDNSAAQWPALAFEELRDRWNINVNPEVIELFKGWLAYSQDPGGGFNYDFPDGSWLNFAKAGAGLAMLKWAGFTAADANVMLTLAFLDSKWTSTCSDGNLGSLYAMYAFYKGMKFLGLGTTPAGHIWEDIYQDYLVANQNADGSWSSCGGGLDMPDPMKTGTALAMLAPAVAGLPPVADAGGPYGPINSSQVVNLIGAGSFHQDASKNLIAYEWDFDASDGLWWDSAALPGPGEGAVGINVPVSYLDTGSDELYTVTLRVTDDSVPAMMDLDTSTVEVTSGNVAPQAITNGPWAGIPGVAITFDGSGSFDPNECAPDGTPSCLGDSIVLYEWDLDGDGIWNEPGDDGTPVTPGDYSVVTKTFPTPTSGNASLRVTDSFGKTNTAVNQILSIAVTYATDYSYCYTQRTGRFTYTDYVRVEFVNVGNGVAENLVVTLNTVPTNRTIISGVSALGDLAPGASAVTYCDAGVPAADIQLTRNVRIVPLGDWSWTAEFDFQGQHYIIPNLPPLTP